MRSEIKMQLLVAAVTSFAAAALLSGYIACLNVGFSVDAFAAWGFNVVTAWPVAFAAAALLGWPIRHISFKLLGVRRLQPIVPRRKHGTPLPAGHSSQSLPLE